MPAKEMMGVRFEKLLVIARAKNSPNGTAVWICRCDCGEIREIAGTGLRAGRNKSCGCASPKFTSENRTKHGQSKTRAYQIWAGMRARCSEFSRGKSRRLYYEKGIRVCQAWGDFECFIRDMGHPPAGASIDRINGLGDYEPENCRWATPKEQANNLCTNSLVNHMNETMSVSMWSEKIGVKPNTLLYRLRRGIPVERALQLKIGHIGHIKAASRSRNCLICGAAFIPRNSQLSAGRGIYCSQACNGISRSRK